MTASAPAGRCPLTYQQLVVLRGAANGLTNADIGRSISRSPDTVATHMRRALAALDATCRAQAVALAMAHGWLTDEDIREPAPRRPVAAVASLVPPDPGGA